jgi:hypothetical protein
MQQFTAGQVFYNSYKDTEVFISEVNGDEVEVKIEQDRRFGQASRIHRLTVTAAELSEILERKGYALEKTYDLQTLKRREAMKATQEIPFDTKDNGMHLYHETGSFIVLRNHGQDMWVGILKSHGGLKYHTSGENAGGVFEATQAEAGGSY